MKVASFNLTREQELALIDIGMRTLLRTLPVMVNSKPAKRGKKPTVKRRRRMSKAARLAISRRMKAMWKAKRRAD